MCEMSRYFPSGAQRSSDHAYLMVSLDVEGVDFSTVIILQTVETEETGLVQTNLGLPLSQSGTLLAEGETYAHCINIFGRKKYFSPCPFSTVIFLVFAPIKAVTAPLRSDVLLNCGFKQQDEPFAQEVSVEWRLQHRGKGHRVLEMKTRLDDAEGSAVGECSSQYTPAIIKFRFHGKNLFGPSLSVTAEAKTKPFVISDLEMKII